MSILNAGNGVFTGTVNVGSNVSANTTALAVGNSSVNTVINSSAIIFSGTSFSGSSPPTMQTFTANGTWTKPANCRKVKVTVVGAGGGGGSSNSTGGGGGGGGGWAIKFIDVTGVSSQTVTVGIAGNKSNSSAAATAGGNTIFGSYHSANGGNPGANGVASGRADGGTGGQGTGGDINGGGERGGDGCYTYASQYGGWSYGGYGGASHLGPGGGSRASQGINVLGIDSPNYGAGGSAGIGFAGGQSNGGNGNTGIIIVEEFY